VRLHPYLESGSFIAFAHRGGAREAPENSMRAFESAVQLGYTYLETDVHATADGVVIAFHDTTLDRVTNLHGEVASFSFADLGQARICETEPIPALAEVLATWPNIRLNIDVKSDNAVEPLSKLLRERDCLDRVCLASTSAARLRLLREIFGERLCTAMNPAELLRLRAGASAKAFGSFVGRCAQVPERAKLGGLLPWHLDDDFLRAAHHLHIPVHVWTIDDRADMERLIDIGVDGLMTDRPSLLREVLDERGMWWRADNRRRPSRPT
jgi:glycerophosphoryl diester phosphodiesterase